jgi:integrase
MAAIKENRNKAGDVISYRVRACVGRDAQYRQIWRTTTLPRPVGLTPARERKEVERQAAEWEVAQKEEYNNTSTRCDKSKITLQMFTLSHWWKDSVMDGTHTPDTVSFYKHMSDDILAYFGNAKKLTAISTEDVKRYIVYLRTEATTSKGKPLAESSVKHHFDVLRIILRYGERLGYIKRDPTQKLTAKEKPQITNNEIDFLEPIEARQFLACLDEEPLYWRCLMNVLITCGLRRGEAVGLQWCDLDAESLTLSIRRNVTPDKTAPDKVYVGAVKGKDARIVPISSRLLALLNEQRNQQIERYGQVHPTTFIFNAATNPNRPLYPTTPTKWQSRFVRRHHLHDVSPHDLRHTAATLSLEGGANFKQVQKLLGHKNPQTTLRFYAGVSAEAQRRTIDSIESVLK